MLSEYPGLPWLERYRERVNVDPELAVVGTWFTITFTLAFGSQRYALDVVGGRIEEIIPSPRLDQSSRFGFAAPVELWRRFLSPDPPPLYHDFFAMLMRVPEFTLEGGQFRRHAERAGLAPHDEHHARNGGA